MQTQLTILVVSLGWVVQNRFHYLSGLRFILSVIPLDLITVGDSASHNARLVSNKLKLVSFYF
jgi:hypothetical protein